MTITIAVDAMGGDYGPSITVPAVAEVLKSLSNTGLFFTLHGDKDKIAPYLNLLKNFESQYKIVHTELVVQNGMTLSDIVKKGLQTSLGSAVRSVADGKADAVVSGGNTGAFMALSKIYIKTFEGISRPAIPAFLPTVKGLCLMLDLGANSLCTPEMLLQFALMGNVYIQAYLNIADPKIGLLNIGTEVEKGHKAIQEAADLLKNNKALNYQGFVEGNNITQGFIDVIVTDGFTGNVALKTIQGSATLIKHLLTVAFSRTIFSRIGYLFCKRSLAKAYKSIDQRYYNGAPFLGLKGVAIKSHGHSDAVGFANALKVAINMAERKLPSLIEQQLKVDS